MTRRRSGTSGSIPVQRHRTIVAVAISLVLAAAIHADWHLARPATLHMSLGLWWHWLSAVPVFGLVAWYVARAWDSHVFQASLWIVGGAVVLGGLVEPVWEYFVDGVTFDNAFGRTRTLALVAFVCTGIITYIGVLTLVGSWQQDRADGPSMPS